ncbi:hypothetical protein YC2023_020704 [Brassica napus]
MCVSRRRLKGEDNGDEDGESSDLRREKNVGNAATVIFINKQGQIRKVTQLRLKFLNPVLSWFSYQTGLIPIQIQCLKSTTEDKALIRNLSDYNPCI